MMKRKLTQQEKKDLDRLQVRIGALKIEADWFRNQVLALKKIQDNLIDGGAPDTRTLDRTIQHKEWWRSGFDNLSRSIRKFNSLSGDYGVRIGKLRKKAKKIDPSFSY